MYSAPCCVLYRWCITFFHFFINPGKQILRLSILHSWENRVRNLPRVTQLGNNGAKMQKFKFFRSPCLKTTKQLPLLSQDTKVCHSFKPRICRAPDQNFPDSPVVKIPGFQYKGHRFNPWLGNEDPTWCKAKKNPTKPQTTTKRTDLFVWDWGCLEKKNCCKWLGRKGICHQHYEIILSLRDFQLNTAAWPQTCNLSSLSPH